MTEGRKPGSFAPSLREASFSGWQDGARRFVEHVVAMLPPGADWRLLELGTGMGDAAILIREARPATRVTAIDFAPANIATAKLRATGAGVTFVCADYLEWQGGTFDLIASDGVLHLIEAPPAQLAEKLATDLAPGGRILAIVPDLTMPNQIRLLLRRLWRLTPKVADRLALALAARLYPGLPRQMLADRLPYLRVVPRLFGANELRAFAAAGLVLERNEPWPNTSVAKLGHRLMVWRRAA